MTIDHWADGETWIEFASRACGQGQLCRRHPDDQVCYLRSANRIYVQSGGHDEFVDKFVRARSPKSGVPETAGLCPGKYRDLSTKFGSLSFMDAH
ncbi:hypothetical protein [Mesorhizobium sp. BHbsci]